MAYKGGYIIDPPKNLPAEKCYTVEWDYYSIIETCYKRNGPKS